MTTRLALYRACQICSGVYATPTAFPICGDCTSTLPGCCDWHARGQLSIALLALGGDQLVCPADGSYPAGQLRDAASYLLAHGWHQGTYYSNPDIDTAAASVVGALTIVSLGYPATPYEPRDPDDFDPSDAQDRLPLVLALIVLAEHLGLDEKTTAINAVQAWNDDPARTMSEVVAQLHAAADHDDTVIARSVRSRRTRPFPLTPHRSTR
jgi:hypothetical protein